MSANRKFNFVNLVGGGNTLVSTGHGTLHTVVINTTSTGGVVLYDGVNTSGTKIATIAASPVIGSTFRYDAEFTAGLFAAVGGGASDITLSIG